MNGSRKMMLDLREQLQENLRTYLEGMSEQVLDDVCQIVVDTFRASLEIKYEVPAGWTGTETEIF
jgi:hypothetical protein